MSTTAKDWYADAFDFRKLCGDAQSRARGKSAQDFAADMAIKANKRGLETHINVKQFERLCKIAEHAIPKRRAA